MDLLLQVYCRIGDGWELLLDRPESQGRTVLTPVRPSRTHSTRCIRAALP